TWPTWIRSKPPFVKTMRFPASLSAAMRLTSSAWSRTISPTASALLVLLGLVDRARELVREARLRAALHEDDARRDVGEIRGVGIRRSGGEREGDDRGDRVARARDVDDVLGPGDRDLERLAPALEEDHALAAAGHEERRLLELLVELLAGAERVVGR